MKTITTPEARNYLNDLTVLAREAGVEDLVTKVLLDTRFFVYSGSHSKYTHHYGTHGLLKHTLEVVEIILSVFNTLNLDPHLLGELVVSAIWHDYGKVWDYHFDSATAEWVVTEHRRNIHHISRSAIEWEKFVQDFTSLDPRFKLRVTHNILSHHCLREYGSPVGPKGKAAWLLHLADNMSARLDDANRFDAFTSKA